MRLALVSDERIRLSGSEGHLHIEPEAPDVHYSPFHMLAGSLAICVYSVLHSWASNARLSAADLEVEVGWEFTEEPYRVGGFQVELRWPSLPEARRAAAERAAHLCPVHNTLQHPTPVITRLTTA